MRKQTGNLITAPPRSDDCDTSEHIFRPSIYGGGLRTKRHAAFRTEVSNHRNSFIKAINYLQFVNIFFLLLQVNIYIWWVGLLHLANTIAGFQTDAIYNHLRLIALLKAWRTLTQSQTPGVSCLVGRNICTHSGPFWTDSRPLVYKE